jgi:hypothetical protein
LGAIKTRHNLFADQYDDMRRMLAELTPTERASLLDPEFITEDEADIIVATRSMNEPGIPLGEIFAEFGYSPRRRRA